MATTNTRDALGRFVKGQPSPRKGLPSGQVPWNKGRKMTDEEKARLDMSGLQHRRGWNKGVPQTEEQRQKNSECHILAGDEVAA